MSGGSFDYASIRDIEGAEPSEEHERLVDALAEYPGSERAVERARAALSKWRTAMREVANEWRALQPVLKAVEWHHSCDYDEAAVLRALAELK
jgi:hypothetical protein